MPLSKVVKGGGNSSSTKGCRSFLTHFMCCQATQAWYKVNIPWQDCFKYFILECTVSANISHLCNVIPPIRKSDIWTIIEHSRLGVKKKTLNSSISTEINYNMTILYLCHILIWHTSWVCLETGGFIFINCTSFECKDDKEFSSYKTCI